MDEPNTPLAIRVAPQGETLYCLLLCGQDHRSNIVRIDVIFHFNILNMRNVNWELYLPFCDSIIIIGYKKQQFVLEMPPLQKKMSTLISSRENKNSKRRNLLVSTHLKLLQLTGFWTFKLCSFLQCHTQYNCAN